jgi:hypothetical protein
MTPDPYATLGVAPGADSATIQAAFRLRALEQHPDRGGSTAAMAQINAAHAWLLDPARRAGREPAGQRERRARGQERPTNAARRRAPARWALWSPRLASRWSQWVATLAALAVVPSVGLVGGSGALSVAAALLALLVVADRRPAGVPYWPFRDTLDALAAAVCQVLRTR